jgi:hypothetical protein
MPRGKPPASIQSERGAVVDEPELLKLGVAQISPAEVAAAEKLRDQRIVDVEL